MPHRAKIGDRIIDLNLLPYNNIQNRPSELLRGLLLSLQLGIHFGTDLIAYFNAKASIILESTISPEELGLMRRWYKELADLPNWLAAFELILQFGLFVMPENFTYRKRISLKYF